MVQPSTCSYIRRHMDRKQNTPNTYRFSDIFTCCDFVEHMEVTDHHFQLSETGDAMDVV